MAAPAAKLSVQAEPMSMRDLQTGEIISFYMDDPRPLEAGMTFHLIPAVKIPQHGVFTTSDTVLITEDGCETLTSHPRQLFAR